MIELRSHFEETSLGLSMFSIVAMMIVLGACSKGTPESEPKSIESLKARLEQPSKHDVIVVAHRTCWRDTVENSIEGIDRCIELGVDMIEIDVRRTKDGQLVLMHDATVDRTTNGSGAVSELSFDELRALRLRAGAGGETELSNQQVPTLKEALTAAKERVLVNLDIKETLYDQALEVAEQVGSADELVIKMSVAADDPKLVRAAFHGKTYFMPIVRECNDDATRFCSASLSAAVPAFGQFNPIAVEVVNQTDAYLREGVEAVEAMNARLWVNTLGPRFAAGRSDDKSIVDPDENWGFLVDMGVNMIQTDRPKELIRYLEKKGVRNAL